MLKVSKTKEWVSKANDRGAGWSFERRHSYRKQITGAYLPALTGTNCLRVYSFPAATPVPSCTYSALEPERAIIFLLERNWTTNDTQLFSSFVLALMSSRNTKLF